MDEIVRLLASDPRISEMYAHWCELTAEVKRIYTGSVDSTPPLEHEKAFRTIKNMVVQQALSAAERAFDAPETPLNDMPEPEVSRSDMPSEPEQLLTYTDVSGAGRLHINARARSGVGALLRSLARMMQSGYEQQRQQHEHAVDRKLMAKIRRKQQDLGQKFE